MLIGTDDLLFKERGHVGADIAFSVGDASLKCSTGAGLGADRIGARRLLADDGGSVACHDNAQGKPGRSLSRIGGGARNALIADLRGVPVHHSRKEQALGSLGADVGVGVGGQVVARQGEGLGGQVRIGFVVQDRAQQGLCVGVGVAVGFIGLLHHAGDRAGITQGRQRCFCAAEPGIDAAGHAGEVGAADLGGHCAGQRANVGLGRGDAGSGGGQCDVRRFQRYGGVQAADIDFSRCDAGVHALEQRQVGGAEGGCSDGAVHVGGAGLERDAAVMGIEPGVNGRQVRVVGFDGVNLDCACGRVGVDAGVTDDCQRRIGADHVAQQAGCRCVKVDLHLAVEPGLYGGELCQGIRQRRLRGVAIDQVDAIIQTSHQLGGADGGVELGQEG